MIDLTGKTVIITGGASGAGQEIVKCFYKAGANIAITYLKSDQKAVNICEKYHCKAYKMNQSDVEGSKKVLETIKNDFGRIDILVNNAGIYPNKSIKDMSEEDWNQMFDVNTKGVFFLCKNIYELMEENSKIINISSINAYNPNVNLAHYSGSKAAVEMMTRTLALDFGNKTRVNCIAPGLIYREGIENAIPTWVDSYTERSPLHKLVNPSEIGNTAVFLASDLSSGITGQVITVDCGISITPWFENN